MAIIRDRALLDGISVPMLISCIKEHQLGIARCAHLENYYLGKHAIVNRQMSTKGLPNNKLVANHAKYITDIAVGYVTGNPVKYEGTQIEDIIQTFDQIDIVSHDAELAKDLSIFGVGYELYYMSSDDVPIPKVTAIDPRQIFLVVDDTVEYRSLFGVHYYPRRDIDNQHIGWYVHVYTADSVMRYEVKELDKVADYVVIDQQQHYFGSVPIVEYWNNEERQGDYEQQISLIDAYNALQSDRINDKEQLVDAILKIKGVSLGDNTDEAVRTIKLLKELKILELPADQGADADWLVKQMNEADVEILRNAIRDDIHQFAMVPSLTDENFASNTSGVAMKYKLLGLEQLAKIKERYFIQGLRERLRIFANILGVKGKAVDVSDVVITMTRNLPANDIETAQMIATLSGTVSQTTLLSQLSFVDDPQEEVEAVEKQKDADVERNRKAFDMPMDVQDEEEE